MEKIRFYNSLRFKIIFGLIALLTFTLTLLFTIQYFQHREKMIHHLREDTIPHMTQMVNDILRSAMISKNLEEMRYILEVANKYPDVRDIFIMNRVGQVVLSTQRGEVGKTIDLQDATCQVCHHQAVQALNKTVAYSSSEGGTIFRNVNPIYNRQECFDCHNPDQKITGVLVTDFTTKRIDKQLRAEIGGNLLYLLFTIVTSTLVIGIALNQMVIKKLKQFSEAAFLLGRGEFNRRITFKNDDEINHLADSFNLMAKTLSEKMKLERKYLSRIIETQESERRRISRELHDEVGQALTAIKFNLEIIDKGLPPGALLLRERLGEAKSLSSQTLAAMRQLSMDLRPTMLDDLGLIPTLRWYIQNFSNRLNIYSHFQANGFEDKLPPPIETAFYRIIQEALNNVGKYAEAHRVEVQMERKDSVIYVSIKDDGKGFNLDEVLQPQSLERGFGIIGMQERVSLLGGRIDIQSTPGFGTSIKVEIPYTGGNKGD